MKIVADVLALLGFGTFGYSVYQTWGWNGTGIMGGAVILAIGLALSSKADRKL